MADAATGGGGKSKKQDKKQPAAAAPATATTAAADGKAAGASDAKAAGKSGGAGAGGGGGGKAAGKSSGHPSAAAVSAAFGFDRTGSVSYPQIFTVDGERDSVLTWSFPAAVGKYTLYGRSRAAHATAFVVPELGLALDCGIEVKEMVAQYVCLTHTHTDHSHYLTHVKSRAKPPYVFVPHDTTALVDAFLTAAQHLTNNELSDPTRWDCAYHLIGVKPGQTLALNGRDHPLGAAAAATTADAKAGKLDDAKADAKAAGAAAAGAGAVAAAGAGATKDGKGKDNNSGGGGLSAEVLGMDHSVPCVGFVFRETRRKLKAEYAALKGDALKQLRATGVDVQCDVTRPLFAYLGDTTAAVFRDDRCGAQLRGVPVIITECTFLESEHAERAAKTKHTLWRDLEAHVRAAPDTTFVLIHFSLNYKCADIRKFFDALKLPNVVVWV